ncbi:hypothetical protein Thimo_1449 [Thioflavicoccus mobilis 8321]|uniref:Sulfotransferase family protein n=1 Tax=Thioflavicoccus mobilis 8321 TaxID=765912 RepID=L0GY55_9GAMM|nr:sulfotransferase [Thioflavicoccus mobilis]AGA90239.1 hypothetical protein Thimo_1449 [Thioflavicoccus mobilis 8321]
MLQLFLATTARVLSLLATSLVPRRRAASGAWSWRRTLVMIGFLPLFLLVQGIHWLGFALDEILFRGYRRVQVRAPLFVLGVPRSGTTHLHRVLAEDPQLTTFSTWECLFAPSVTERRFWLALARLDRLVGAPAARLIAWLETHAFGDLEAIHPMRLADPEEDYFALTPVLACFILVLPFPRLGLLWRMGSFDRDMPTGERERLLDFYEGCLKRHLYVHGTDKRLLSKNAAFAPLAGSLAERFPDARFIACLRPPAETLPSQLSSLRSGIDLFEVEALVPDFEARLLDQLAFYYENLHAVLTRLPAEQRVWIEMRALGAGLTATVEDAYRRFGLTIGPTFRARLALAQEKANRYRSRHRHADGLTDASADLIAELLATRFEALYERFGLATGQAPESIPPSTRATARRLRPSLQTSGST